MLAFLRKCDYASPIDAAPAAEVESNVDFLVFASGLIAGAGLMAAVIFGTDAWFNWRHPLVRSRS